VHSLPPELKAMTRCARVSGSCTRTRDRGCVCAHEDPAKQLLLMHVSQASYSRVYALRELFRVVCLNNRSQDTDVRRRGVRDRQVYVYCSSSTSVRQELE